jgi:hypothetical protein
MSSIFGLSIMEGISLVEIRIGYIRIGVVLVLYLNKLESTLCSGSLHLSLSLYGLGVLEKGYSEITHAYFCIFVIEREHDPLLEQV